MCFYTAVKKEKKKSSHSPCADGRDDRGNGRLDAVTTLLQTLPVKENVQSEDADNTVTTGFTEKYTGRVRSVLIIIIIINPFTARVVGAPQIILQPVFSIFPVLHCPLGLAELQACLDYTGQNYKLPSTRSQSKFERESRVKMTDVCDR